MLTAIIFTVLCVDRTQRGNLIPTYHSQSNFEFNLNPNPNPKLGLDLGLKLG